MKHRSLGVVDWTGLVALAARQTLSLAPGALERLDRYLTELMRWRKAVNLVGPDDPQRIADELIADAVPLASALRAGDALLDIGAGAGLPGVIVALLRDDTRVELWEPRERRCAFLRAALQATGTTNARVVERRAPDAGAERLPHSILSARAVWPPAEWLAVAARLAVPGARVALHAAAEPAPSGLKLDRTIEYELPGARSASGPRTLALYEVTGG